MKQIDVCSLTGDTFIATPLDGPPLAFAASDCRGHASAKGSLPSVMLGKKSLPPVPSQKPLADNPCDAEALFAEFHFASNEVPFQQPSLDNCCDAESFFGESHCASAIINIPTGSTLSLSSCCASTHCRAVRLDRALETFGSHFASKEGSAMEFSLSEPVSDIDDFISHDWQTGRWEKLATLLLIYNARLAVCASLLTTTIISVLETDEIGVLPRSTFTFKRYLVDYTIWRVDLEVGVWSAVGSALIFLACLLFGQSLSTLWLRCVGRRRVFVDKMCISQTDEILKREGILALAGILKRSRRLVILWSPRYFTRLWCVYEIISWLHHQETSHSKLIRFEPVAWAPILFWMICAFYTVGVYLVFVHATNGLSLQKTVPIFIGIVVPLHWVRQLLLTLVLLPNQISSFSVERSQCFCCSVNHIHPWTQLAIPCDRRLVYKTLHSWAGNASGEEFGRADSLMHFDKEVHTKLLQWVHRHVGRAPFPYEYALLVASPLAWFQGDVIAAVCSMHFDASIYLKFLITQLGYFFFFWPCALKFNLFACMVYARRCPVPNRRCLNVVITCAIVAFVIIVWGFLFVFTGYLVFVNGNTILLHILAAILWAFCTGVVYSNRSCFGKFASS